MYIRAFGTFYSVCQMYDNCAMQQFEPLQRYAYGTIIKMYDTNCVTFNNR